MVPGVWAEPQIPDQWRLNSGSRSDEAEGACQGRPLPRRSGTTTESQRVPTLQPRGGGWGGGVRPSVFVNPKDPDAVKLGQLGNQHGEQGNGVDHKMVAVVFGVEAG